METAEILLSLGGDIGNTVPKYGVTPAEVAVLRFKHGNDAVAIVKIDKKRLKRTDAQEKARLLQTYGRPNPDQQGRITCDALDNLFPGAAARLFQKFDELPSMSEPDSDTFDPDLDQDEAPAEGETDEPEPAPEPEPEPVVEPPKRGRPAKPAGNIFEG